MTASKIVGGIILAVGIFLLIESFKLCSNFIGHIQKVEIFLYNIIWISIMLAIGFYLVSKGVSLFKE